MRRKTQFAAGIIVGAALFGGGAAVGAGVIAEPSVNTFYVDGAKIQLEAYAINGHNYVKLRDVGQAVGFNVFWDGAVQIQTGAPYTGEAPTQATPAPTQIETAVDYSAQANPSIFQGSLTRDLYNAIRDTVVNHNDIIVGAYQPSGIEDDAAIRGAMDKVTAAMGCAPIYKTVSLGHGIIACTATYTPAYDNAIVHTQGFIDGLKGMSEEEQVKAIAWYVCDHLTYSLRGQTAARVLASDDVSTGNCTAYAQGFQFLCGRAGIPCLLQHSKTHQWNKVYVNGRWWDVNLNGQDVGDDTSNRPYAKVLKDPSELQGAIFVNDAPEITAFVMELLVPGSTQ